MATKARRFQEVLIRHLLDENNSLSPQETGERASKTDAHRPVQSAMDVAEVEAAEEEVVAVVEEVAEEEEAVQVA